jgi:hypothetical protein
LRNVDPNDAINSKTPLNKLLGSITPQNHPAPHPDSPKTVDERSLNDFA